MKQSYFKYNRNIPVIIINIVIISFLLIYNNRIYSQDKYIVSDQSSSNLTEKEAEALEHAANKILDNGLKLYKDNEFWKSAHELIVLLDYYPKFDKTDKVLYYLAECLFEEELTTASIRIHKYLLKKYPDSEYTSFSLLGMEKAYYHENNYKQALRVYYALTNKEQSNSEILNAAQYYAGQSHFNINNFDTAVNILKKIENNSKYYGSALYTTALAYLKKSNVATTIDYLNKIIALPIISGERRDVVDNSRLTLGYIYFELKYYQQSCELFRDISDKHSNYQDALLGLGWAYSKLEDHDNAIKYLSKLVKKFPKSANAEEAYFLLGQSYIAMEKYDEAIESYGSIVKLFPEKHNLPSLVKKVNNQLNIEENRVEQLKVKILVEETKLLDHLQIEDDSEGVPSNIIEEKKKLLNLREKMIDNLLSERDNLLYMQENIDALKNLAERRERRKDWRGYAEYGISRALFLKNVHQNRGN